MAHYNIVLLTYLLFRATTHASRNWNVTNEAFSGHADSYPFNFQRFNLNEIALYLYGQQRHAIRLVKPDYERGLYVRAYDRMCAGTRKLCKDEGLYINRDDYASGYALYTFDLNADLGEDDHFGLVRQGSVRLALKIAVALAATVTVIFTPNLKTSLRWTKTET